MAAYEIGPEFDQNVCSSAFLLPMNREIYPIYFPTGIIDRIGGTALSADDEDVDTIRATFGDLVE